MGDPLAIHLIKAMTSRKLVLDEYIARKFRRWNLIPQELRPSFWDTNLEQLDPVSYPAYTIGRVLEYGDEKAIRWLRDTFSESQVVEVLRTERRLSRKSANFWAIVYHIPSEEIAALKPTI
jgi:hypothetical protein